MDLEGNEKQKAASNWTVPVQDDPPDRGSRLLCPSARTHDL